MENKSSKVIACTVAEWVRLSALSHSEWTVAGRKFESRLGGMARKVEAILIYGSTNFSFIHLFDVGNVSKNMKGIIIT